VPDAAGQASPLVFQQGGQPRLAVFSAGQACAIDPADGNSMLCDIFGAARARKRGRSDPLNPSGDAPGPF